METRQVMAQKARAAVVAPRAGDRPPGWLLAGMGAGFVVAALAFAFWPGASLIDRLMMLDGGICVQNPTHSFFPAGVQLPLCSRNTGIYSGFACTLLWLKTSGRLRVAGLPGRRAAIALVLAALLMAEDGFNSLFRDLGLPHLYLPNNLLRLATGLGMGVAMAAFLVPAANQIVWHVDDDRSSFASLRDLLPMLPMLMLAWIIVASQASPFLYPIAIVSSAGLVTAVSLLNVVVGLGASNQVGRFMSWRAFLPIYGAAIVLAVVELMALFLLKEHLLQALTQ
jgi:uncharacterized membrane protein